jgi:hypothetical protein
LRGLQLKLSKMAKQQRSKWQQCFFSLDTGREGLLSCDQMSRFKKAQGILDVFCLTFLWLQTLRQIRCIYLFA